MSLKSLISGRVTRATNDVVKIQDQIRELQAQIQATENAPMSIEETTERIDALLDAEAARAREKLCAMVTSVSQGRELNSINNLMRLPARKDYLLDETGGTPVVDIFPMLATLLPDQLRQMLTEEAKRAIGKHGLTADERESRLVELREQLHKLEVEEEQQIAALEEVDVWVPRREDCRRRSYSQHDQVPRGRRVLIPTPPHLRSGWRRSCCRRPGRVFSISARRG